MAFNKDEFYNLDYTHDELEFLLDKINNGNVLSNDEYEKLIKIELDSISTFSGDYNDLINKPDFISEIRNSIETLNLETSDSVEQKLNLLRTNIIDAMQSFLATKAEKTHTHYISEVSDLSSALNAKADFSHTHTQYDNKIKQLEDAMEDVVAGNIPIDLTNLITKDMFEDSLNNKANKEHLHTIATVTGLQEELDSKFNKDETLSKNDINSLLGTKADLDHSHNDIYYTKNETNAEFLKVEEYLEDVIEYVTNDKLYNELSYKSGIDHSHNDTYYTKGEIDKTIADVVSNGAVDLTVYAKKIDVDTALIGKADREHAHDISNIDNLQDVLNNKLELKDIQEMINNKADREHAHAEYVSIDNVNSLLDEHKQVIEEGITQELLDYVTIENLNKELDLKSDEGHNHDIYYSQLGHEHNISDISELQNELDSKINKDVAVTKTELKEGLNGKSDITHIHDDRYYTIEQVDTKIDEGIGTIDLTPYAKTADVNIALAGKADSLHGHSIADISELQNELDLKALKSDVYTKKEIEEQMAGKSDKDHNHDDRYYTQEQVDDAIEESIGSIDLTPYATTEYVNTELAKKSDVGHAHDDMYSKLNHDHKVENITDLFDNVYSEDEIDDLLTKKSDVGHAHDDVYSKIGHNHIADDITDLYDNVFNKKEITDLLSEKSNVGHGHNIEEIENLQNNLDLKANVEDVYAKTKIDEIVTDINAKIDTKANAEHNHDDAYSKLNHGHKTDEITDLFDNVYKESEIDALLAGKSDTDHKHDEDYAASDHEHEVDEITDLFDNIYKEKEVDDLLSKKSDIGHGHKTEEIEGLNDKLELKADIANVYNKTEINEALAGKSDKDHAHDGYHALVVHSHNDLYYTEDEINTLLEESIDQALILAETTAQNYTNTKITDLIDSAPEAMDTLNELASAINDHQGVYEAYIKTVSESLAGKSDKDHAHDDVYYTKAQVEAKIEEGTNSIDLTPYAKIEDIVKGYSPLEHKHESSEITDLQSILDSKIDANNAASKKEFDALVSLVKTKADANHDHDDDYSAKIHKHTISEIEDLLDNVYTEDEVDSLLSGYSQSNHDHKDLYYTKTEIDENITSKLNSIDHSAYALKTEVEEALGSKSDTDHKHEGVYLEKNEIENLIGGAIAGADLPSYATKELLKTELAKKASVNHTHDQSEIEDLITTLESKVDDTQLDLYTTKVQVKDALATKSDASHNHDDKYSEIDHVHDVTTLTGMYTNFYTKTQVENRLAAKADSTHKHNIEEITDLQKTLDNKANTSDVYTKSEINSSLDLKLDKSEINMMTNEIIDNAFNSIIW